MGHAGTLLTLTLNTTSKQLDGYLEGAFTCAHFFKGKKMNKRLLIVTPTYDQRVHTSYMLSVLNSFPVLYQNGIEAHVIPSFSSTLLVYARNSLIQMFYESGMDYAMMIDSDLGFDSDAILKLIKFDKDIVVGAYPSRHKDYYNIKLKHDNTGKVIYTDPLIKIESCGAGFMLVKRRVIAKMIELNKHKEYKNHRDVGAIKADTMPLLFNTDVFHGEFYSEDVYFCRLAEEAGFDLWCYPDLTFCHDNVVGNYSETDQCKKIMSGEI